MAKMNLRTMENNLEKIGMGGGCHWCTEAVFEALKGVHRVEQGFVSSTGKDDALSEAVIVYFDPTIIPLKILIEIHLYTHKSTSNHSMRSKYRSALYSFSNEQQEKAEGFLIELQPEFQEKLVTKVYSFKNFEPSPEPFQNYYSSNPERPFCQTYITPKLKLLLRQFNKYVKETETD